MYKVAIVGAENMIKEYIDVVNKIKYFRVLGVVSKKKNLLIKYNLE